MVRRARCIHAGKRDVRWCSSLGADRKILANTSIKVRIQRFGGAVISCQIDFREDISSDIIIVMKV
jgi:hypothetical protein